LNFDLIKKALDQAKAARLEILDKIYAVISGPRDKLSAFAPRIVNIKISLDKIKDVIGPGGKVIRKIISETGVTIDIDDQAGEVKIASANKESLEKAVDIVKKLIEEPEIGKMYLGKITKIANFGAFCEILPGKEGLIHVSELAEKYVSDVSSEVKVGEEVLVKIIEIDQQGRINLSRKQVLKAASGEKNKNKT